MRGVHDECIHGVPYAPSGITKCQRCLETVAGANKPCGCPQDSRCVHASSSPGYCRHYCRHGIGLQFGCGSCGRARLEYCNHGNDMNLPCVMCDDKMARLEVVSEGTPDVSAFEVTK